MIIKYFHKFYKDMYGHTEDYLFIKPEAPMNRGMFLYQRVEKIVGCFYIKIGKPFYLDDMFYEVKV